MDDESPSPHGADIATAIDRFADVSAQLARSPSSVLISGDSSRQRVAS